MPDGDELRDPDLVLRQDRLQRVVPAILLFPVTKSAPSHPCPGGSSSCPSFAARRPQVMQPARRTGLRHTALLSAVHSPSSIHYGKRSHGHLQQTFRNLSGISV